MNSRGFPEKDKMKMESDFYLDKYQKPNIKDIEMEPWNGKNE